MTIIIVAYPTASMALSQSINAIAKKLEEQNLNPDTGKVTVRALEDRSVVEKTYRLVVAWESVDSFETFIVHSAFYDNDIEALVIS